MRPTCPSRSLNLLSAIPKGFSAAPARALDGSLKTGDARTRPNRLRPRAFSFPQTKTPGESKVAHQISSLDCGKCSTSLLHHPPTTHTNPPAHKPQRPPHSHPSVSA